MACRLGERSLRNEASKSLYLVGLAAGLEEVELRASNGGTDWNLFLGDRAKEEGEGNFQVAMRTYVLHLSEKTWKVLLISTFSCVCSDFLILRHLKPTSLFVGKEFPGRAASGLLAGLNRPFLPWVSTCPWQRDKPSCVTVLTVHTSLENETKGLIFFLCKGSIQLHSDCKCFQMFHFLTNISLFYFFFFHFLIT